MKKLALALTATAALAGQAIAADMPARMPVKAAPVMAPVASWTGCYINGGGGYGIWKQENYGYFDGPPRVQIADRIDNGGEGYFGTVGGGCDYQFALGGSWQVVVGAFGDYDFADIHGKRTDVMGVLGTGDEKLSSQWAVGGRVGVLITPQLLSYFSGGYTEATFDRTNFTTVALPFNTLTGRYIDGATYKGWFLGSGYEYALSFMPGLFWKTEYRYSQMDRGYNPTRFIVNSALTGDSYDTIKHIHTVRSELVWRFNMGGPVVAKY